MMFHPEGSCWAAFIASWVGQLVIRPHFHKSRLVWSSRFCPACGPSLVFLFPFSSLSFPWVSCLLAYWAVPRGSTSQLLRIKRGCLGIWLKGPTFLSSPKLVAVPLTQFGFRVGRGSMCKIWRRCPGFGFKCDSFFLPVK